MRDFFEEMTTNVEVEQVDVVVGQLLRFSSTGPATTEPIKADATVRAYSESILMMISGKSGDECGESWSYQECYLSAKRWVKDWIASARW